MGIPVEYEPKCKSLIIVSGKSVSRLKGIPAKEKAGKKKRKRKLNVFIGRPQSS